MLRGVAAAREFRADLVVAVGGGSAMDCAKGVNLLLTNGGRVADYEGYGRAKRPTLPSVGVPTTAGTGSEAQSYALLSASGTHRKMACGDASILFAIAVLDPELIATTPRSTAAATGLDAMAHAIESFVARTGTETSRELAATAWGYLDRNFEASLEAPHDVLRAGAMLLGAHFAGAAIEASMLGAAHSLANPLTARYATTHGFAVALMLPHVIRFNAAEIGERYAELARLMHVPGADAESLARRFEAARSAGGGPADLREAGVERGDLGELARLAGEEWTLRFNPRAASIDDLRELYEHAY